MVSAPRMKIGVAKEIKQDEYRVALTPAGAFELVKRGHDVGVEAGLIGAGLVGFEALEHASASG